MGYFSKCQPTPTKPLLLITMAIVIIWLAPAEKSAFSVADDNPAYSAGPTDAGYKLPWQYCRWKQVTQGWGGSYSHNATQMWYAYDFGMAEGTGVRAAKGGTVAFIKSNSNVCGGYRSRNDGNYVTINHNDGTATLYLHLKYNSVYVSVGQGVSQGQTIGPSGNTGWTNCNAHLHFQRQVQGNWITNSTPIYFDEYPGQQLQTGSSYRSLNYWPGDNCPQGLLP